MIPLRLSDYNKAAAEIWQHHDLSKAKNDPTNLIRYAAMSASSHNSQPWKFRIRSRQINIIPDFNRRCPAADPDDHHLFASLGCAVTNLVEAAAASGQHSQVNFDKKKRLINIDFESSSSYCSARYRVIPDRQCCRTLYEGSTVSNDILKKLERAGTGKGVSLLLITDPGKMKSVAQFVQEGNQVQMSDRYWIAELRNWLRFNPRQALLSRDGLYAGSLGSPVIPGWIGDLVLGIAISPKLQSRKDHKQILSSAGLAVFISQSDDPEHWTQAGMCFQSFALEAAVHGLQTAFANPPIEVAGLRAEFGAWLGLKGERPSLIVRFGRGQGRARSLRRAVEEIIIKS